MTTNFIGTKEFVQTCKKELFQSRIFPGYRTDHSLVLFKIDIGKFQKGNRIGNSIIHC